METTLTILTDKANASLKRIGEIEERLNSPDISPMEEEILDKALNEHRWVVTNALRQKRKITRRISDYASKK